MYAKTSFFLLFTLLFACTQAQSTLGVWKWTWSGAFNYGNANLVIAFNGWADPGTALSSSNINAPGEKYISLGGGNDNGRWSSGVLSNVQSYCSNRQFSGFAGIAFDIEEGDSGLSGQFISTIQTCKNSGYKILITTSHSSPYGISDGPALMQAFFSNAGLIDYMSPQLYTSGTEGSNDYTANGVSWQQYAPFSGKLIPSIVSEGMYQDAASHFASYGVTTIGFVQWAQQTITGTAQGNNPGNNPSNPPPPPPPPATTSSSYRCGSDWTSASSNCGQSCPSGTDNDCPSGQHCYANLAPCQNNNPPPPPPPPAVSSGCPKGQGGSVRCGPDWTTSNNQCGCACSNNGDCPSGQYCWAGMNSGCNQAVDGSTNTYSSPSSSGLEPAAIGIIVAGVIVGVVMIVVAIVMIVSANKRVEKA